MRSIITISVTSVVCLLAISSIPAIAADMGEVIVETKLGRAGYPCVKYQEKLFIPLQGVAELVSGGRTLEPALALRGRELRAMPAMDGSSKMPKVEYAKLQLNPSFAKAGRSAVISSNVVEIKGQMWVPVNDFAKAIGAKPQSDSRQFEEIKVTYIKVPSDCGSCPLVTARR